MRASRAHARSFRLGCRCYAVSDAAAIALLVLVVGAFVLQIVRLPIGAARAARDEMVLGEPAQCVPRHRPGSVRRPDRARAERALLRGGVPDGGLGALRRPEVLAPSRKLDAPAGAC